VRYGDALKAPIPEELSAACRWWLGKHTPTEAEVADLPIACQTDGHSCGMLVDNAQAHFVDPTVPLDAPTHVANSRLEMFNRIATRGLEQACYSFTGLNIFSPYEFLVGDRKSAGDCRR
jgi:hypothetical protein